MFMKILSICLGLLLGVCPLALGEKEDNGLMSFSTNTFNAYLSSGEQNIAVSPLSAYLALSMAMRGADSETLAQFELVLGVTDDEVLTKAKSLRNALKDAAGEDVRLVLANSLWMNENKLIPNGEWTAELEDAFDAEITLTDFSTDGVAEAINQWISGKTEGMIPRMIDSIKKGDALFLINTLFLDAKWAAPFLSEQTRDAQFTLADGSKQETSFMNRYDAYVDCYTTDEYEAIVLKYRGEKLAFIGIRPLNGKLDGFTFDSATLLTIVNGADVEYVDLSLPKFTIRFRTEMRPVLEQLGLADAFSESGADFSRIGTPSGNLFLSSVLQEVLMRVDEEGTQAAAATVIAAKAGSANIDQPRRVSFDTPFIYAIVDVDNGIPMFLGTYDNP